MIKNCPLIIGHRGDSANYPENTLESLQSAFDKKADMVEFDVRMTQDKHPIIIHDSRLERTTNGEGYTAQKPLSYIKKVDAGYHFDPFNDHLFPFRNKGLKIPTFEEVLNRFHTKPLAIEVKEVCNVLLHNIMAQLKEKKCLKQVIVGSKHHKISSFLKKNYPEIKRFTSRAEIIKLRIEYKLGKAHPKPEKNLVVSIPLKSFGINLDSQDWIDFLHKKEIEVFYWTIDDEKKILELAKKGVDGIITNNPEKARKILHV